MNGCLRSVVQILVAAIIVAGGSRQACGWNQAIAKFDVNLSESATITQAGHTAVVDSGNNANTTPFSATDANGVTLTVSRIAHNRDRDRLAAVAHPESNLLRDMTHGTYAGTDPTQALRVDVTGLQPGTEYRVRVFSYDRTANNNAESIWTEGTASVVSYSVPEYRKVHRTVMTRPNEGFFDLWMTTDAAGALGLLTRAGTGGVAIFNGLEIYPAPPQRLDIIKVDVNKTNDAQSGPSQATAPGYVGLNPGGPAKNTGSVSANGVIVTVTSDTIGEPTRHRNNIAGEENVFEDFIFATDLLTIDIAGLIPYREYEITILSQDLNGNSSYKSAWYLNGSADAFNGFHFNANNLATRDKGWKFSTQWLAVDPQVQITGRFVAGTTHLLFLNGIEVRETGRRRALAVEFGATGQDLLGLGFQPFTRASASFAPPQTETYASVAGRNGTVNVTVAPAGTTTQIGYRDRADITHPYANLIEDLIFAETRGNQIALTLDNLQRGHYEIVVYSQERDNSTCGMNLIADGVVKDSASAFEAAATPLALRTLAGRFYADGQSAEVITLQATDTTQDMRVNGFELYNVVVPGGTLFVLR